MKATSTHNPINWPSSTGPSVMVTTVKRQPPRPSKARATRDNSKSHYNTPIPGRADADKTRVISGCGSMWRAA